MIRYAKMDPTVYVIHYRNGRVIREGAGLSFLYFEPAATLVSVPLQTSDVPFVFQELTADFQTVTVQGQLSFRVALPRRLAALLNYAVDRSGEHVSDDPLKLGERLLMAVQATLRGLIAGLGLKAALKASETLATQGLAGLKSSELAASHGLEILALSLVAIRPAPETAKALEAEAREALLRAADQAIYARRTAAVEQERTVKETELETEISIERMRAALVDQKAANDRKAADARAYALERTLAPIQSTDWRMLVALGSGGADSRLLVAQAFERLADNAAKIGQLNITPDLLSSLIMEKK